jgi:RNA polymerase sigma factor FliA
MYNSEGIINREEYLTEFAPLVKRTAHHMMAKLPASVQVDDLIQAGMIGLLDAISRYQGSLGAKFETYAVQRIRGAILDELRQADWLPRSLRKNMRSIESAVSILEQRFGRAPNEQELANEMNISLSDYQEMLQDSRGCQLIYYEDFAGQDDNSILDYHCQDNTNNPLELLLDENFRNALIKSIENLPEREKAVMGMHYEQDLNLREIGEVLGVSESRVCQLHSQAIARLRSKVATR